MRSVGGLNGLSRRGPKTKDPALQPRWEITGKADYPYKQEKADQNLDGFFPGC